MPLLSLLRLNLSLKLERKNSVETRLKPINKSPLKITIQTLQTIKDKNSPSTIKISFSKINPKSIVGNNSKNDSHTNFRYLGLIGQFLCSKIRFSTVVMP